MDEYISRADEEEKKREFCENHFKAYMGRIAKRALMSRKEEIELARKIDYHFDVAKEAVFSTLPGALALASRANSYIEGRISYNDATVLFGNKPQSLPRIKVRFPEALSRMSDYYEKFAKLLKNEGPGLNGALNGRFARARKDFLKISLSLEPRMGLVEDIIETLQKYVSPVENKRTRFETSVKIGEIPSYFLESMEKAKANQQTYLELQEQFFEANLRLAYSVARRYSNSSGITSFLTFMELLGAANEGLLRGVRGFDSKRKYRLSTYAYKWIRQRIDRAVLESGKGFRKPYNFHEKFRVIMGVTNRIRNEKADLDYNPSPEEIAARCNISPEIIRKKLENLTQVVSLEDLVGDENSAEIGDFIQDNNAPDPSEEIGKTLLREKVREVLGTLDEQERTVLYSRFGFPEVEGETLTLEQIGKKYNVTRERIRQIQSKALRKLRHPTRLSVLKSLNAF